MATAARMQSDLLQQGSRSYLDALAALEAFRRKVESICQQAYDRHEADLLRWMGIAKAECELHDNPCPEERWAELGIIRPAGKGISDFYVFLQWSEDADGVPEVEAAIDLEFYTKTARDKVMTALRKHPGCRAHETEDQYWSIHLSGQVALDGISAVGDTLDGLLSEWTKYCKAAGGLRLER